MGCQKNIVEKIVEKKADYVLALKDNHRTLLEEVILSFYEKHSHDFHQTINFGHGRIEERKCGIIKDLYYIFDRKSWINFHAIVRIDSQRTLKKTGEIQEDTLYFLAAKLREICPLLICSMMKILNSNEQFLPFFFRQGDSVSKFIILEILSKFESTYFRTTQVGGLPTT
jgi:hypothetical protein